VNGKQDGDERHDPLTISLNPIPLFRLEARSDFGQSLGMVETDVGDDALVDIVFGVRRSGRDIDCHPDEPDSRGDSHDPVRRISAEQQHTDYRGKISERRRDIAQKWLSRNSVARRCSGVSERVEREGRRHEDRQRGDGQPGGVQEHERKQQGQAGARPGALLRCGRPRPEAVNQLGADPS
jgi:hypothetical protein